MKKAERGEYRITRNEKIGSGIYEICLEAPDIVGAAAAGQFVNVYLSGGEMLLPRPISIADADDETLILVYAVVGKGTRALAGYNAGSRLEVMGPLGTGFFDYEGDAGLLRDTSNDKESARNDGGDAGLLRFARNDVESARNDKKTLLLIGGGTGIPPLHFAARKARDEWQSNVNIVAALGYPESPWYEKEFEKVCDEVYIASERRGDAPFTGNVVELLRTHDEGEAGLLRDARNDGGSARNNEESDYLGARTGLALACGPLAMLEAAYEWCAAGGIPLRVSMEQRMGCGYGACSGCMINGKKVCADGPVFWAGEVFT